MEAVKSENCLSFFETHSIIFASEAYSCVIDQNTDIHVFKLSLELVHVVLICG